MTYDKKRSKIPRAIKREVKTAAGHRCMVNRCLSRETEVHHIDGNRENNSGENLVCLCPSCHTLVHRGVITKNELEIYIELASNPLNQDHDRGVLLNIEEIFSYEVISKIQREQFQEFVEDEVVLPFESLVDLGNDTLFAFKDPKLESLKNNILKAASQFLYHFFQQAVSEDGGFVYIVSREIDPKYRGYFEDHRIDTVTLANDFCKLLLELRRVRIRYEF